MNDKLPDDVKDPPMFYDPDGRGIGLRTWCRMFEQDRILARTEVELPGGQMGIVSTVWMGIDMNYGSGVPLIYETAVFFEAGNYASDELYRWPTREAALAGHDQMVIYARTLGVVLEKQEPS